MSAKVLPAGAPGTGDAWSADGTKVPTVLVVDDVASCREMVAGALRAQGFNIRVAGDGAEAMASLETGRVDLVISDLNMPGMDGMEFLRLVRGDPRWKKLPVIMLTSATALPTIKEALHSGICGYLLKKECSLTELLTRVRLGLGMKPEPAKAVSSQQLLNRVRAAIGIDQSMKPAGAFEPAANSAAGPAKASPPAPSAQPAPAPPPPPAAVAPPPAVSVPNLVTREATLEALSDIAAARTLPGIITSVAEICGAGKVNLNELAATIKQDPILSARVIQLVNSAAGKNKAKVLTIENAIRSSGAEAIANLTSSIGMLGSFDVGKADGLDLLSCWQHAIATATVMARIVPQTDKIGAGLPHLVGLCHDLPEILLRQRFPSEYAAASDHAAKAARPTRDLLEPVFGVSLRELTRHVLNELKFPPEVGDPINEFTRHIDDTPDACTGLMSRSLAIANAYVHGIMLSTSANERVSPVALTDCRTVLIKTEALNMAEVRSEAITGTCMLAKLTPEQESVALKPLLKSEARIWYARHNSFAPLDPLEAAMAHLCNVVTHDRMPHANELSGLGGMIIAAPNQKHAFVTELNKLRADRAADKPVLTLVAPGGAVAQSRAGIDDLTYPITMERLAKFISTVKVGD